MGRACIYVEQDPIGNAQGKGEVKVSGLGKFGHSHLVDTLYCKEDRSLISVPSSIVI